MNNLMDITQGKRVFIEDLDFAGCDSVIACVLVEENLAQLTPPLPSLSGLVFLFLNGREEKRFILLSEDPTGDDWLGDDGKIYSSLELADLPLKVAASRTPLTPELLRRFDS